MISPRRLSSFAVRQPLSAALLESHAPLDTVRFELNPRDLIEREVVYLACARRLKDYLDLTNLPRIIIAQSYFHKDQIPSVVALASTFVKIPWSPRKIDSITNARIRHQRGPDAEDSYILEIKTPRGKGSSIERDELPIPLSGETFERLAEIVPPRHLRKYRFLLDGSVTCARDIDHSITAHIDLIIDAGPHLTPGLPKRIPSPLQILDEREFLTVDVELPCRTLVKPLRQGRHSFTFLRGATELSAQPEEHRKSLSTRRLASRGLDRKARSAARAMLRGD